ncbi:MAG: isoamylase early set domain-containing protein [Chloroflexi bacterium]|nr:isoamylase early set domain-containing protein [Chloroflexota bacterium]
MPKKTYTKSGKSCRVTFELSAAVNAQSACLCGEFNSWDASAHPMRRRKDGSFALTLSLTSGQEYRYRFLLDGARWENDWAADAYAPNPFGADDSVVQV